MRGVGLPIAIAVIIGVFFSVLSISYEQGDLAFQKNIEVFKTMNCDELQIWIIDSKGTLVQSQTEAQEIYDLRCNIQQTNKEQLTQPIQISGGMKQ